MASNRKIFARIGLMVAFVVPFPSMAHTEARDAAKASEAGRPVVTTQSADSHRTRSAETYEVCPRCGRTHGLAATTTVGNRYQVEAEYEARQMATRRFKGHLRGPIAGVRFCGVGWSSHSPTPPTCTPGSGMTLVADAIVRGSDGWYRVRYWR
ncbi:MAG: hypothetical protein KatS3mg111_0674 [Pirellulaceae bacterium]|nr:MAG: hypothetical protein KatS3mg111_0674 [Pirellulaceae bacterium]